MGCLFFDDCCETLNLFIYFEYIYFLDGSVRYTHIKVTRAQGYFIYDINGSGDNMYTADNICKMIEFFIDNIFVQFGGRLFRQVIGIPMGTNCAPLLAEFFFTRMRTNF